MNLHTIGIQISAARQLTKRGRISGGYSASLALDCSNESSAIFRPLDLIRKTACRSCERANSSKLAIGPNRVEQDTTRRLLPSTADGCHGNQTLICRYTGGHVCARSANVRHVHEFGFSRLVIFGVDDLATEV